MTTTPKDALATLGTLIDGTYGRDAIHLAVIPIQAGTWFMPGERVRIKDGLALAGDFDDVGIVDPFLTDRVEAGEWFWLVLLPRTITSLRHVWTHPAFPDEATGRPVQSDAIVEAEQWLTDFCARGDSPTWPLLKTLIEAGTIHLYPSSLPSRYTADAVYISGEDARGEIPPEFWDHVETVLGRPVPFRPTYFSCGC